MRILTIIAIAAMTFGFVSCAKHAATTAPVDGKTMHGHGYKK
jgi:Spy/CpxP family protein refolding chaperone